MTDPTEQVAESFVAVLSTERFGDAQMVIGNTLHDHKPTRWSRLTSWLHRKRTGTGGHHTCRACGHTTQWAECFEYHQADAVIAAIREWC